MTHSNKTTHGSRLQDAGGHILTSDGAAIHYTSQGVGPAVLLLHGLGSSGLDWQPQVDYLARNYQVVTLDTRGHGRTPASAQGYSIAQFAQDARAVLDALAIEQAQVVGLSMGGAVAFQVAVAHPERVTSLVIVNSGPSSTPPNLKFRFYMWLRLTMARLFTPAQTAPRIAAKLFPEPGMEALRQTFIERVSKTDPMAYRNSLKALFSWSVAERIGQLRMPTLFVSSEHDYTPPAAKQPFVDAMPNARLEVVPGAYHGLPMEKPEAFNAVLGAFLAQNRRG